MGRGCWRVDWRRRSTLGRGRRSRIVVVTRLKRKARVGGLLLILHSNFTYSSCIFIPTCVVVDVDCMFLDRLGCELNTWSAPRPTASTRETHDDEDRRGYECSRKLFTSKGNKRK